MAGNVHMTKNEAENIKTEIDNIVNDVRDTTNNLDRVMQTLVQGSEGDEIDALHEEGTRLIGALGSWMTSCIDIGVKIGEYVKAMIRGDAEGAQRIKDSMR